MTEPVLRSFSLYKMYMHIRTYIRIRTRTIGAKVKTFFGVGSPLKTFLKQPPQVNEHNLFLFIPASNCGIQMTLSPLSTLRPHHNVTVQDLSCKKMEAIASEGRAKGPNWYHHWLQGLGEMGI